MEHIEGTKILSGFCWPRPLFFPCKILLDSLINSEKKDKIKQNKTTSAIFLLVWYLLIIYPLSQEAEDLHKNEMLYNVILNDYFEDLMRSRCFASSNNNDRWLQ